MTAFVRTVKFYFNRYGLGFVIAAGFFGAGSIYILSASGIRFGYGLLWAVLLSGLIGVKVQSMSILVGIFRKPLMTLISEKIGKTSALILALYLSAIALLWVLELRAADGMALSLLMGERISWELLNYAVGGLSIFFIWANVYNRFEKFITTFLLLTVLCFIGIACFKAPVPGELFKGFIPHLSRDFAPQEYIVLVVCILGTTVLWPNLFLQSTIVKEKGWRDSKDYAFAMRDTILGFGIGILGSASILIASATIIKPMGIERLDSFITPALILSQTIGVSGSVLFLVGLFLAAFNSSIVITSTLVYILHQAVGKPVRYGDKSFVVCFSILAVIGSLFPLLSHHTGMSIVDAIILFPGVNGALGLPFVIMILFGFKYHLLSQHKEKFAMLSNLSDLLIVILTLFLAARSIGSLKNFLWG